MTVFELGRMITYSVSLLFLSLVHQGISELCAKGFEGNGSGSCINIDECTLGLADCDINADCVDINGGYKCQCRPGYTGDGSSCHGVSQCVGPNDCTENAECVKKGTVFKCACRDGYTKGNNNSCIDIDECAESKESCDANANCVNTAGSFGCLCKVGFSGDGLACQNLDECSDGSNKCVINSDCNDTDGSYTCTCSPGFIGDGFLGCRPILDCIEDCHIHAICVHINGGSECVCDIGYTGDGYTCTVAATPNQGNSNNALTVGTLFGAFGLFLIFFTVASVVLVVCMRHKGMKKRRKHLSTTAALVETENAYEPKQVKFCQRTEEFTSSGHTYSNPEYVDIPNGGIPGAYDHLPPVTPPFNKQAYDHLPPITPPFNKKHRDGEMKERAYEVIDNDQEIDGPNNTTPVYHELEVDNSRRRGTICYCLPANEEKQLYAQIAMYGVNQIPSTDITVIEILGSGDFGTVSKGLWTSEESGVVDVAVKTLTDSANTVKFLQEAAIMAQFRHPNILTLHGIVTNPSSKMIVVELMSNGDLRAFLKDLRPDPGKTVSDGTPKRLLEFSVQIAIGMNYLASKGFIHRDLAARNVLVSKNNICKIADFGMARDLLDENYYVAKAGRVPVKWCAPEVLNFMKYTTASDVWSYGCVLYEIWSLGKKPYAEETNAEAIALITGGKYPAPPPGCPKAIYRLMVQCWNMDAVDRPPYTDMLRVLTSKKENILAIPQEELPDGNTQALMLGAPLDAGKQLYEDLQN